MGLTAVAVIGLGVADARVAGPSGRSVRASTVCSSVTERLPDLVQELPKDVSVDMRLSATGQISFLLGFATATANQGRGPLRIIGRRTTSQRLMRAEQLVARRDGGSCRYPDVGRLGFDFNQSHDHWHLRGFDRYSLTALDGAHPVAPVRKAGFCLNDDERAPHHVRGMPSQQVFTGDCKLGQPEALTVTEGISPGWADVYAAYIEGQVIDITRVPAGRYVLANQVNPHRTLREANYTNDAASLLIRLAWPHGRKQFPTVRILSACPHSRNCHLHRS